MNLYTKWICIQNRNRLTDMENKPVVSKGERDEERAKLGIWD